MVSKEKKEENIYKLTRNYSSVGGGTLGEKVGDPIGGDPVGSSAMTDSVRLRLPLIRVGLVV